MCDCVGACKRDAARGEATGRATIQFPCCQQVHDIPIAHVSADVTMHCSLSPTAAVSL